jgi:hypothetical protein
MRPNNSNNRRSRGRGGRKSGNSRNQTFDSNGPGARVRGNASQIYEKYQQLARDAASGGDRVGAENFLQHAEHYYRLMIANGPKPEQRNGADDSPREDADGNSSSAPESEETNVEAKGKGNVDARAKDKDKDTSSGDAGLDADSLPASLKPNGKGTRGSDKLRRSRKSESADADESRSDDAKAADEEAESTPA